VEVFRLLGMIPKDSPQEEMRRLPAARLLKANKGANQLRRGADVPDVASRGLRVGLVKKSREPIHADTHKPQLLPA
jgi:hypothetical protein